MKGVNKSIKNPNAIPVGGVWRCTPDNCQWLARLLNLHGHFEDLACTNYGGQQVTAYAGCGDDDFIPVATGSMLCLMQNIIFERFRVTNDGDAEIAAGTVTITLSKSEEKPRFGGAISKEWI